MYYCTVQIRLFKVQGYLIPCTVLLYSTDWNSVDTLDVDPQLAYTDKYSTVYVYQRDLKP